MRVAGIMSGTSLDGVDVAVVEIQRRRLGVLGHRTFPYPERLRERVLAVSNATAHIGEISRLNFDLARAYARCVKRMGVTGIELIGCHGQTVFHERGSTLQLGDGPALCEFTGIATVSNFRTRDVAAGGQGAPLVPFFDYWRFRSRRTGRVALNIGGIANITVLPPRGGLEDVVAFDTGPGNMVMDQLVWRATAGRRRFDRNGALARRGRVNRELLDELLRDEYYQASPPKTAGREQYGREFVDRLMESGLTLEDLMATATALTASTIALAIERWGKGAEEVIVSGGGAHNRTLMQMVAAQLPGRVIRRSDEFGIDVDAKEAIAFAVLAYETWRGRPGNVPAATGARRAVILGEVARP